jgi:glutamate--cysteine ligase
MSRHLGERGRLGHHMMKGTAGVQVNVDFTSEEDAASLVRTALAVSPVVNALVANSPLEEGQANGFLTKRPRIWLDTDPERCGVLPWVIDEGFTFERYADWALDVTVMFLVRGQLHAVGDRTFRQLLDDGHPVHGRVTFADFALHLTTLFPEIRVKQHVEIRGADACSLDLVAALTALWRGVLYDEVARAEALDLLPALTGAALAGFHEEVGVRGLAARCGGKSAAELATELVAVAAAGLERLASTCGVGSEASLLSPLVGVIRGGRTPAELLLDEWHAEGTAALLARG